jgi:hypothetical protein
MSVMFEQSEYIYKIVVPTKCTPVLVLFYLRNDLIRVSINYVAIFGKVKYENEYIKDYKCKLQNCTLCCFFPPVSQQPLLSQDLLISESS